MSSGGARHIVVIDDVCRFALHLWSYLAGVPGFGIGSVPSADDEGQFFWSEKRPRGRGEDPAMRGEPKRLDCPDGRWSVWWAEARGRVWEPQLTKILGQIRHLERVRFLIDVRGPAGGGRFSNGSETGVAYDAYEVRQWLSEYWQQKASGRRELQDDRVVFVSSYKKRWGSGRETEPLRLIREKTAATFESLRKDSKWAPPDVVGGENGADELHILVTGAGFDFGGREPALGLGIEGTATILREALGAKELWESDDRLWPEDEDEQDNARRKLVFPVPKRYFVDRGLPAPKRYDTRDWHHFIEAAEEGDLDAYWENLLRLELARAGEGVDGQPFDKVKAAAREHELREAFRSALVRHDWGQTRQTLDALQISCFRAWLTTNYTRIPNRALHLLESHGLVSDHERWDIVSTSNEATLLLRRLLHQEGDLGARMSNGQRYLFKLHGDIPHVTTMALAGSDKEIFSPLSMPIDSLHWLYTTAQKYLESRLRPSGGGEGEALVVWHIVGHGLKDQMLVDLMARVCQGTGSSRHRFVITGKMPAEVRKVDDPGWILASALERCGARGWQILRLDATALDLMAHMKADGSWRKGNLDEIARWAESFGEVRLRLPEPDNPASGA